MPGPVYLSPNASAVFWSFARSRQSRPTRIAPNAMSPASESRWCFHDLSGTARELIKKNSGLIL